MAGRLRGRVAGLVAGLLLWQGLIAVTGLPPFLLPGPLAVAEAAHAFRSLLAMAALHTAAVMVAGFVAGSVAGCAVGLAMAASPALAARLRGPLLMSQIVPVFALAPILTLWLGYGMAPKVAVVVLVCFFPVASAFLDGLDRPSPACMDLARTMGATRWRTLWHLRIPLALPGLCSGMKLAAAYASVGAVIGEWVGGSEGLGAVMLHANGRMRIDLTFAALAVLTVLAVAFHGVVCHGLDRSLRRFVPVPGGRGWAGEPRLSG